MIKLRNIFSVAPDCHAPSGHYTTLWQRHFYGGLRSAVNKLVTPSHVDFAWARNTDLGNQNESRWKNSEKLWHHIKTTCESNGLDAVISYCFARDLEPDLVRQTIKLGVPWINF